MSDEIFFNGAKFISANDASSASGLTRDYIARLCRDRKVIGRRVGKNWYVSEPSLKKFLVHREYTASSRSASLSEVRRQEYHGDVAPQPLPAKKPARGDISKSLQSSAAHASQASARAATHPAAPLDVRDQLARALAARGKSTAEELMKAPAGTGDAAMSAMSAISLG